MAHPPLPIWRLLRWDRDGPHKLPRRLVNPISTILSPIVPGREGIGHIPPKSRLPAPFCRVVLTIYRGYMVSMSTLRQSLSNPTRFMELSATALPWVAGAAGLLLTFGLYLSFTAPLDYQQGHAAKIMFVHVPTAWLSMFGYVLVAVSSFGLLVFRHPLADVSAKAAAPIGAVFTLLCLLTGSLWGKPMWGVYWVWDPRLTSVLVLFLLYIGLIALRSSIEDETLAAKLTAVLSLVGIVILPVIKFSVEWNSLHQPASVMRLGPPTIHPSLLWPLLVMAIAMSVLFVALYLKAMRNEVLRRRLKALRAYQVRASLDLARQPAE